MLATSESQRRQVFARVLGTIEQKFMGDEPDIGKLREEHEAAVLHAETSVDFEQAINAVLKALGTSHTGFFHEQRPRAAGRSGAAFLSLKAPRPT